jgi:ABC-2 type transport system permease protein
MSLTGSTGPKPFASARLLVRLIRVIAWKEFQHLKYDPVSIRLMIVPVALQALIMGYAITTEIRNTPLVLCDKSRTPESRTLSRMLTHHRLFEYTGAARDEADIRSLLDAGVATVGIVIPAHFSRDLQSPDAPALRVLIDGQDANAAGVISGYVNAIVSDWSRRRHSHMISSRGIAVDRVPSADIESIVLFNPLLKSTWYMVPALAVLLVTMVTALLTGFSIVREKESGTLEQLMVTPLSAAHLVIGKSIPFLVIGLLELTAILMLAKIWFQIPFAGSYAVLIGFSIIYMFTSIGIGILVSTISRTPHQALFVTWFVLLFFILLSGFFIPVENMPVWVQKMTLVNPVRYFMTVIREIFLKGAGPAHLWQEAAAMGAIGVAVYGIAVAGFRRKAR